MKTMGPSILTSLVVVISTLAWIAGVSFALVYLFDLSEEAGWWIAGLLGCSSLVAMIVIRYEMRHAVDLTPPLTDIEPEDPSTPVSWRANGVGNGHYLKA